MDNGIGSKSVAVKPKQHFSIDRVCGIGACIEMTGGKLAAAILLLRIFQRLRGKGLQRHGKKWIALTRDQMCTELGGKENFSLNRYNEALATLKRLGLVECMHAPINGRQQEITHLRLTDEAMATVAAAHPSEKADTSAMPPTVHLSENPDTSPGHLSEKADGYVSEKADTYTKETSYQGNQNQGKGAASPAASALPPVSCVFQGSKQEGIELKQPASCPGSGSASPETSSIASATPTPGGPLPVPTAADMAAAWKSALHRRGQVAAEIIGKERGQLGTLAKAWAAGDPVAILSQCVEDWEGFIARVREHGEKDYGKLPFRMTLDPTIPALMAYPQFAMDFAIKGSGLIDVTKIKTVKAFSVDPVTGEVLIDTTKIDTIEKFSVDPVTGEILIDTTKIKTGTDFEVDPVTGDVIDLSETAIDPETGDEIKVFGIHAPSPGGKVIMFKKAI